VSVLANHLRAVQRHVDLLDGALRQERERRKQLQAFANELKGTLRCLTSVWRRRPETAKCASELESLIAQRFL